MLGNRKLVLDTFCEVYDQIKHLANDSFWDFKKHTIVPGAVYLIGRKQFTDNAEQIKALAADGTILPVLSNPAEGSDTMISQINQLGLQSLLDQGRVLIIAGGYMPDSFPYLYYENFLPKILDYTENLKAIDQGKDIYTRVDKPYKFLFLNGRMRTHRKYLLERFRQRGLLEQSLWTNLDSRPIFPMGLHLEQDSNDIGAPFPVKYLPEQYEVDRYQPRVDTDITDPHRDLAAKFHLFNNEWGEIYLNPAPYIDTYFSLVTETVFDYPYTFRTEKIWKPIAIGHPWIVAGNRGYYRDMQQLGFKTFGHLIDESFDLLDNKQDRIERLSAVVEDLCQQNLPAFLAAAEETCKYNQHHLVELRTRVRQEFPQRFEQFINERS